VEFEFYHGLMEFIRVIPLDKFSVSVY
jgi:hypothetical protein